MKFIIKALKNPLILGIIFTLSLFLIHAFLSNLIHDPAIIRALRPIRDILFFPLMIIVENKSDIFCWLAKFTPLDHGRCIMPTGPGLNTPEGPPNWFEWTINITALVAITFYYTIIFKIAKILIMKKTLIILSALILLGCQQTYTLENFTVEYPENYSIVESTSQEEPTIIEGENGKIEIYDTNNFDTEIIHGYSSSGLEEYEAILVPKEKITKENYEIWLYYIADDDQTKTELQNIADSIIIKH